MSTQKQRKKCPVCGKEMNRHADKVFDPTDEKDLEFFDDVLGGILHEIHCCPNCGFTEAVRSAK